MYTKSAAAKESKSQKPGAAAPLTPLVINRMRAARVFQQAVEQDAPPSSPSPSSSPLHQPPPPPIQRMITSVSFDDTGEFLITAGEDERFLLYNAQKGKAVKTLYSKKYGVDLARFTHKPSCILHASTKEDHTIRYHSLHDNRYLQYFKGHKKQVICLEMHPENDTFLSASNDNTVRLWDIRSPTCHGLLPTPRPAIVAFDNTGVVFAVGLTSEPVISLYDAAAWDHEPFLDIRIQDNLLAKKSFPPRMPLITSITFSSNGKWLLVGTAGDTHYIVDSYTGDLIVRLEGHSGLERGKAPKAVPGMKSERGISGQEVAFTPDSKFVIAGSHTGKWHAWDLQSKEETMTPARGPDGEVRTLFPFVSQEGHIGPVRCVRWNPRMAMMATGGAELAFWVPEKRDKSRET